MDCKGFSLVEVKICCLIIAIVSVLFIYSTHQGRDARLLNKEIRTLLGNFQSAKLEAIKRNANVVCNLHAKGYTIFVDNGAGGGVTGDWIQQQGEPSLVHHQFASEVMMSKTTFTLQRTRFTGKIGVKAGSVFLTLPSGRTKRMVMSTIGRLRIEG